MKLNPEKINEINDLQKEIERLTKILDKYRKDYDRRSRPLIYRKIELIKELQDLVRDTGLKIEIKDY